MVSAIFVQSERGRKFSDPPEKTSTYHSLEDERAIFLELYEAKRDIKLSTDRRKILNGMHNQRTQNNPRKYLAKDMSESVHAQNIGTETCKVTCRAN